MLFNQLFGFLVHIEGLLFYSDFFVPINKNIDFDATFLGLSMLYVSSI